MKIPIVHEKISVPESRGSRIGLHTLVTFLWGPGALARCQAPLATCMLAWRKWRVDMSHHARSLRKTTTSYEMPILSVFSELHQITYISAKAW